MKNYLLLLLAMMTSLCALAKDFTLEEVRDQWTSREIKVANGGKNPNIVQLLTAFQNVWGTYVVAPVLKCAKDPRFTSMRNEEENKVIIVDRKNGYVCLDNGGTDSGYMEAVIPGIKISVPVIRGRDSWNQNLRPRNSRPICRRR